MAARGDRGKVDSLYSDINIENNLATYAGIPESCVLFSFGKCHEATFDGQHKV